MSSAKRGTGKSQDRRFKLPTGTTFVQTHLPDGMAYVFRHVDLGVLGRLAVRGHGDAQCLISCEVVGDPRDPMTSKRREILEPITMQLSDLMSQHFGGQDRVSPASTIPMSSFEPNEVVESKILQCERCDAGVAHLIFADRAVDLGGLEDYARLMYAQVATMNLPTWVIGPQVGGGPPEDRPADILKIWPTREAVRRMRPREFDQVADPLVRGHCKTG